MNGLYLSLIYPKNQLNQQLLINDDDFKTLFGNYLYCRDFNISEFMTDDVEIIQYRQEIFEDILNEPEVLDLLQEILPILENINELYRLKDNSHETEGQIYSIKLIELYIELINKIYLKTEKLKGRIKSRSLLNFAQFVADIATDEAFIKLVANTQKLSKAISQVKSVTIGMNLDATFSPYEFGVLSLNNKYVISNDFIGNLINRNEKDNLNALCPLKVMSKSLSNEEKRFAVMAIGSVLNRLFKGSIKEWEPAVKAFFRQNTKAFLPLIKELKYLLFGAKILNELKEAKMPLTVPIIKPKTDKTFSVRGLYNPLIALSKDKIVLNDIEFDENGRIYLILGPNSGGKSVFTSAVGICQVFTQLGFLVPAKYAEISPVDRVFVCFTNKSNSKDKGRLEEECVKVKSIFESLTEHSFVLMDETFSSTDALEGKYIALDVLKGMSAYGCKGVFSTHLHELTAMLSETNNCKTCKSKIDTLSADIDENGNRNYKILRTLPDGKSYAKSIADKYGLKYETLIEMRRH